MFLFKSEISNKKGNKSAVLMFIRTLSKGGIRILDDYVAFTYHYSLNYASNFATMFHYNKAVLIYTTLCDQREYLFGFFLLEI